MAKEAEAKVQRQQPMRKMKMGVNYGEGRRVWPLTE